MSRPCGRDDGFVIRLPDSEEPLETDLLLPSAAELKDLVLRQLGSTSLFAAKFREAAGRALLLPRRRPGMRAPLWQQRKRAADLLAVASRYSSLPHPARNLSRVRARSLRPARPPPTFCKKIEARRDSRDHRRIRQAFALRLRAAVLLHRQLHLRWRRSAGRTARAGALHRSIAARRDPRQHRFPRTARQSGARRSRSATAVARSRLPGAPRGWRARSAAEARRSDGRRNRSAQRTPRSRYH